MSVGKRLSPAYQAIHSTVRRVPRGRVASYGQVAREAGLGNAARQVGYALHALPAGSTVPWHRVVNAQGSISLRNHHALTQRLLLTREGIRFDARGRIDLARQGWKPRRGRVRWMNSGRSAVIALSILLVPTEAIRAQGASETQHGFVLVEQSELEEPNAGTMYRYQRPDGIAADVFVFPFPPGFFPCRSSCAERAVNELSTQFADAIPDMLKRGYYDTLWVTRSTGRKPPKQSWLERGRFTEFAGERHRQPIESRRWLFLGQETLVEVRITTAPDRVETKELDGFIDALLVGLLPHYGCVEGESADQPYPVSIPIVAPMRSLSRMVDSVLTALGYTFDYRSVIEGRWRTTPRVSWPAGAPETTLAAVVQPGIEVIVATGVGSDRSVVGIVARPVCRLRGPPKNANEEAFVLSIIAMNTVRSTILDALGLLQ